MNTQPNRAKGVDVSVWKPVKSWTALADGEVTFIGMKATEGNTFVDKTLGAHVKGFRQSQLALGIYYHFSRPGSAQKQAERLVGQLGTLQPNERFALDLEGAGPTEDPDDAIKWVDEFFKTVHGLTKRYPMLYTSARIWRMMGDPVWALAPRVSLWLPRWASGAHEPKIPPPWAAVTHAEAWAHGAFEQATVLKTDAKTVTLSYGNNVATRPLVEENVTWRRAVPAWTIWQWTDGRQPDHDTPGVGHCDANWFRGDEAALRVYAETAPV